jgi:hypothetical protein
MKKLLISLGFLALLVPFAASAADFRSDSEKTVTIGENESAKNLYAAGKNIVVESLVTRDLAAAGNNITINKGATGSLFAAGNNITVKGEVGGSSRIAGSVISYGAKTSEDLFAAGSAVSIADETVISGDAFLAGNDVSIGEGQIHGDLKVTGSMVTIGGFVYGDVVIRGASQVSISDGAIVKGDFIYYAENPVLIGSDVQILGKTEYHKISVSDNFSSFKSWIYVEGLIYKLLGGLLVSFFLLLAFSKFSKVLTNHTVTNFWTNLGWGFFTLFVVPITAMIIFSLFLAAWFGFAITFLYILYLMLAAGSLSVVLGSFIDKVVNKKKEYELNWKIVLIGTLLTFLLGFVKVIGPALLFFAFVAILGSLFTQTIAYLKKR